MRVSRLLPLTLVLAAPLALSQACGGDSPSSSSSSSSGTSTSATSGTTTTSSGSGGAGGAGSTTATGSTTSTATSATSGGGGAGGSAGGGQGGTDTDGGSPDGCVPLASDGQAIDKACVSDAGCPSGYTCKTMEGFVVQQLCEILCTTDCDCPDALTCKQFSDKAGMWTQCAP